MIRICLVICFIFNLNVYSRDLYDFLVSLPKDKMVYDCAEILNKDYIIDINNKLLKYKNKTSVEIVIITINDLQGYNIENLANKLGDKFAIGHKDKDNGIIILISKQDRKLTIRTGYGIQKYITPIICKKIIKESMIPNFKNGDYSLGINLCLEKIINILEGKYQGTSSNNMLYIYILLIFFIIYIYILNRNNYHTVLNNFPILYIDSFLLGRNYDTGRFQDNNDRFGGFGGGSFGGGGASGDW